ncbi:MAG: hypothetical protein RL603_276, partial [Pseudomonadota bacterium]
TIADFVADLRAPTPSGAAELVAPDSAAWRASLAKLAGRFTQSVRLQLRRDRDALAHLAHRLQRTHPGLRLQQGAQRLDELEQRLGGEWRVAISNARARVQALASRLAQHTPTLRLERLVRRNALLQARLERGGTQLLESRTARLALASRALHAVSPLATLERGFAIVTRVDDDSLVRAAADTRAGDEIRARLGRGALRARVLDVFDDDGEVV